MFVFLSILRPPRSTRTDTLFPYTTLFRSDRVRKRPLGRPANLYDEHRRIAAAADQLRRRALCDPRMVAARRPDRLHQNGWRRIPHRGDDPVGRRRAAAAQQWAGRSAELGAERASRKTVV